MAKWCCLNQISVLAAILAAGITNRKYLGHDDLVTMEPAEEIPRVFDCWSYWLSAAGICDSLDDVDMLEMHVFGKLLSFGAQLQHASSSLI